LPLPRQGAETALAAAILAKTGLKAIKIRNPNAVRPWQFVLEPLRGYILLGEKLLQGKKEFAASFNGKNNAFAIS
jgi:hypothetical protein